MDFLARDTVSFSEEFWERIDKTVVSTVKNHLIGRRVLPLFGPLGPGATSINIDTVSVTEEDKDGFVKTNGRRFVEIPQIYEDFSILWRDIEHSEATGIPLDLSKVMLAAQALAQKEDRLIFFGSEFLGHEGIFTTPGVPTLQRKDWLVGDNAYTDIAAGLAMFRSKGIIGSCNLVLSPDLYVQLHRIIPGLGMTEAERISKLLNGNVFESYVLGTNKAVFLCAEPQYMDLVVGKDIETGYLESKDFNHVFRILETVALRIKMKDAIVIFE